MIPTSEPSCDVPARASEVNAVDTAVSTPPPMTHKSLRRNSMLRAKRPARERQKKARFELLHSMTEAEERRAFLIQETAEKEEALQRLQRAAAADSSSQRIAIDLSFDSIMNDKEIRSLANQLKLSYGLIKQMSEPFQLVCCNPSAQLEHSLERFGASNWHIQWRRSAASVAEHFPPEELIYLSPDSPNVLEKMDPTKIYVIGGIVDKSRKKGASLNAATEAGITTVRLPIQEHITERLDHILNVNTVVDVLINFREIGDWPRALDIALPQRKRSQIGRKAIRRRQKQQMLQNAGEPKDAVPIQANQNKIKQHLVSSDSTETPEAELSLTEDLSLWQEV
ncbi:tRNA methyltransferase TRM10-type domain [Phytophthora cactorum]|nr:tRNA methyltransferase TRM10-type domain [Phytophthora cactorum]